MVEKSLDFHQLWWYYDYTIHRAWWNGGDLMYRNLIAEMARRGITADDISRVIGKSVRTARDKLNGKYPFFFDEAVCIKQAFFSGMELEYLFAETPEIA